MPKPQLDPVLKSLIDSRPSNFSIFSIYSASQEEELKNTKSGVSVEFVCEGKGTDSAPQTINMTEYKSCPTCKGWYHVNDMSVHTGIHSSQILDWMYLGNSVSAESRRV